MACNKRRIVNAGDPFGSCANRPITYDILILRHKWETRKQVYAVVYR